MGPLFGIDTGAGGSPEGPRVVGDHGGKRGLGCNQFLGSNLSQEPIVLLRDHNSRPERSISYLGFHTSDSPAAANRFHGGPRGVIFGDS